MAGKDSFKKLEKSYSIFHWKNQNFGQKPDFVRKVPDFVRKVHFFQEKTYFFHWKK
jgi:hypothetical protein